MLDTDEEIDVDASLPAVPVQDALTTLLKELRDLNGHEAIYLSGEFVSKDCVDDIVDRLEAALRREPPAVRTEKD